MISAGELAFLRAESDRFLTDTCVIQRLPSPTPPPDAYGGQTEVWADLATVACRVSPSQYQPNEPTVGGRPVQQATYVATFAAGTDITAADRISWNGRVLQVVSIVPRSNEIARRVYCVEQV